MTLQMLGHFPVPFLFLKRNSQGTNLNQIWYAIGCKIQLSYQSLRKKLGQLSYDVIVYNVSAEVLHAKKVYIIELMKCSCSKTISVRFRVVFE